MYVITGGAGFIGSNLAKTLCSIGEKVVICDYKSNFFDNNYISRDIIVDFIEPKFLINYLAKKDRIKAVIHLGANSSTTETNGDLIWKQNILSSIAIWNWCSRNNTRLVYASSAATYGNGENHFIDDDSLGYLSALKPLNIYGWSKSQIDIRVKSMTLNKGICPPQWVGLKFFNVFGPNEYHKGHMSSVVLKAFLDVKSNKNITLYKSHNKKYDDGEQMRDFIYVADCIKVILWVLKNPQVNGIYNCGTGKARTFIDLAKSIYLSLGKKTNVQFIDTPINIRNQYQYRTEANMNKLIKAGYNNSFSSLENSIHDYITNYLLKV